MIFGDQRAEIGRETGRQGKLDKRGRGERGMASAQIPRGDESNSATGAIWILAGVGKERALHADDPD